VENSSTKFDNRCVITVPASFNEQQRRATKDAANIAGLEPLAILNEPTAACIYYAYENPSEKEEIVLVYDFGGGTLDVSLVSIKQGTLTVLATSGDSHFGGSDIDYYIFRLVNSHLKEKYGIDLELPENKLIKLAVLQECEEQKKILSVTYSARIIYSNVGTDKNGKKS